MIFVTYKTVKLEILQIGAQTRITRWLDTREATSTTLTPNNEIYLSRFSRMRSLLRRRYYNLSYWWMAYWRTRRWQIVVRMGGRRWWGWERFDDARGIWTRINQLLLRRNHHSAENHVNDMNYLLGNSKKDIWMTRIIYLTIVKKTSSTVIIKKQKWFSTRPQKKLNFRQF